MSKVEPQAVIDIPTPVGPTRYVKVEVINPIIKQGKEYKEGDEAVLELFSAENFVKAGDVKILEEVENG